MHAYVVVRLPNKGLVVEDVIGTQQIRSTYTDVQRIYHAKSTMPVVEYAF